MNCTMCLGHQTFPAVLRDALQPRDGGRQLVNLMRRLRQETRRSFFCSTRAGSATRVAPARKVGVLGGSAGRILSTSNDGAAYATTLTSFAAMALKDAG